MPALFVLSQRPRAGKTAVAVGLAQRLRQDKRQVALIRVGPRDDESAAADAGCFAALGLTASSRSRPVSPEEAADLAKGATDSTFLIELPPGEASPPGEGSTVLVQRCADLDTAKIASPRVSFAGLIVTATPTARLDALTSALAGQSITLLAALPEDRLLAAPTIGEMAAALDARALFIDGRADTLVERMTIASIAADPGQGYFVRFGPQAVIVRCDKPDLHLAALHTSTLCLILTGGHMPLAYVTERAESEGVPILITAKDTPAAIAALEPLYGGGRFGGQAKAERIGQLMAERADSDALRKVLASGQK
jgi:BioD-like phosphotransacetylase family protein